MRSIAGRASAILSGGKRTVPTISSIRSRPFMAMLFTSEGIAGIAAVTSHVALAGYYPDRPSGDMDARYSPGRSIGRGGEGAARAASFGDARQFAARPCLRARSVRSADARYHG